MFYRNERKSAKRTRLLNAQILGACCRILSHYSHFGCSILAAPSAISGHRDQQVPHMKPSNTYHPQLQACVCVCTQVRDVDVVVTFRDQAKATAGDQSFDSS